MKTHLSLATAVVTTITSPAVFADITLEPVIVTASKTEHSEFTATYASEVYTAEEIASSGASSLYDFLNQNTSITVMPAFGNPYSQLLDMRGFGIGDGYQNILVSVDGRSTNNIDQVPQLLSAISLNNIERIEITKGSGSVVYGDGATAGSIQIYTKGAVDNQLSASIGSYGYKTGSISAGLAEEFFTLSVSADHAELDGVSDRDPSGHRDESDNNNSRLFLEVMPTQAVKFHVSHEHSNIDTRYVGPLTLAQFNVDPSKNNGSDYTHQTFHTDTLSFGTDLFLADTVTMSLNHADEEKESEYIYAGSSPYIYDYQSDELLIKYRQHGLTFMSGVQRFDGIRTQSGYGANTTRKKNVGYFVQGEYVVDDTVFSLGGRRESVDYRYAPVADTIANASHHLTSYDLGINKQLNDQVSIFSNYNVGFQAPDIDRFFTYTPFYVAVFNNFIAPAKVTTINVGLNHISESNKTKITVFRSNLDNEIYYFNTSSFLTSFNTNIDKSHKYGLELQNRHKVTETLSTIVNYAYSRAIIDQENEGNGAFNGKDLPGVSRHNITIGLHYSPTANAHIVLSHNYRSSAYAINDFANNFTQKQRPYQSTNLAYTYSLKAIDLSLGVDNLFDRPNGLWIQDDSIYPINFTRQWRAGLRLNF